MYLWTFCVIAAEYYSLLSIIKNIVDINGNKQFVQKKYNNGTIAFDLTQCISGNGEVVMKILDVGKLHIIIIFAIINFFSAVIC